MKIGIMSMQRIVNYGSFLQAYGLKKVIEGMGHSVVFVDYLPGKSLIPGSKRWFGSRLIGKAYNLLRMTSPAYRQYRREQIRMNRSFSVFYDTFQKNYFSLLGISEEKTYCSELDVLVIGSDEVFNCTQQNPMVGYSLQLFGKDNNAKKLISYAASFGSTTLAKLEKYNVTNEIADCLRSFDAVSVRDENSAEIVKELIGASALRHIDPVLLYSFPETDEIKVALKDYIVVYAYAGRIQNSEAEAIRKYAEKYRKKILCLGFWQPFCDEYVLCSPFEALAYVKCADYVITDTFHGTVYSIKYQKPFATIIRESNQQKIRDLLTRFDLTDRSILQMKDLETILHSKINWSSVNAQLCKYQDEAKRYLGNMLCET